MKSTLMKAVMLATAGLALVEIGLEAQAADITVIDSSSSVIHPYFKSNCWDPTQISGSARDWVFFGGIGSHSQFTWTFEGLLKAKCKNPKVRFTYVLDGEAPPVTGHVPKKRKVVLDFDPTVPVYTITIGDDPVITDVTPGDDDNDDDD